MKEDSINQENIEFQINSKLIFSPKFIPFSLETKKKYELNWLETLIFGFIDFYLNNASKKFYFTNEDLAQMFSVSESTINNAISSLVAKKLIKSEKKMKTGGGTYRLVSMLENYMVLDEVKISNYEEINSLMNYEKTKSSSLKKLRANNNNVNNNNLNNNNLINPTEKKSKSKTQKDIEVKDVHKVILDCYNFYFRKGATPSKDFSWTKNADKWLETYSLEEIKVAMEKWSLYDHLQAAYHQYKECT